MNARRSSFPFANAPYMNAAQQTRGLYQIGLTDNQLLDLFTNADSFSVSITCVPDILDADLQLLELGSLATLGGYFGAAMLLDYGSAWLSFLENSIAVTGSTVRRACPPANYATANKANPAGLAYPVCRDLCYQHMFTSTHSQFMLLIDFGATVRKLLGQKNNGGDWAYYPAISLLGVLGGYALATDVMLLQGAGVVNGGITLNDRNGGTIGVISSVNALCANNQPPIGQPSFFGSLTPQSLYDNLKWVVQGGAIVFSGVPFTNIPGTLTNPAQGLFLDGAPTAFTANADGSIAAVIPPGFTRGYAEFRAANGNYFTSRKEIAI